MDLGEERMMDNRHLTGALMREVAEPLFMAAVAQGANAPFALDCEYWGRQYADKLLDALDVEEDE